MKNTLYAFTLGREYRLSLAELFSVFWEGTYIEHTEEIAIFSISWEESDIIAKFRNIGGSIRVMRIVDETDEKKFPTDVIRELESFHSRHSDEGRIHSWKILDPSQAQDDGTMKKSKVTFALGAYGLEYRTSDIWLRIKKTLGESDISSRLVNTENKNIVSAFFKRERLWKSQTEYNLIRVPVIASEAKQSSFPKTAGSPRSTIASLAMTETYYLAVTLACQDIDAYTRRDTGKTRDMIVGMMPPKLCQMMINLARSHLTIWPSDHLTIYDPFCGLGTILIEWVNMGITTIYGSDISPRMVETTDKSLDTFVAEEKVWHDRIKAVWGTPTKDFTHFQKTIFVLDASTIWRRVVELKSLGENTVIVSEWYLWEIMGKESISPDRIQQERAKLRNMYDGYFGGLCAMDFPGHIVMSFPFWTLSETTIFFSEIYDVIGRHGFDIVPLLPVETMRMLMTPKWSLLYRRPNQNVWREIVKIIKK